MPRFAQHNKGIPAHASYLQGRNLKRLVYSRLAAVASGWRGDESRLFSALACEDFSKVQGLERQALAVDEAGQMHQAAGVVGD